MALTRSMVSISRRMSVEKEKSKSLTGEVKKLKQEILLKNEQIRSLHEKLNNSNEVNKALNKTISDLNDQIQEYVAKIEYERGKNKQRSMIFMGREQELLKLIAEKDKMLRSFNSNEGKMKGMLEARDRAIESTFKQFEITKEGLTDELNRTRNSEKKLKNALDVLQKEFYENKQKLNEFEYKGKTSGDLVKVFQNIVADKDTQLKRERARLQELEHSELRLAKSVNAYEKELKFMRTSQEIGERLRSKLIKTSSD